MCLSVCALKVKTEKRADNGNALQQQHQMALIRRSCSSGRQKVSVAEDTAKLWQLLEISNERRERGNVVVAAEVLFVQTV